MVAVSTASADSLAGRLPGTSVISELHRLQSASAPRGLLSRLFGRSPLGVDARPWYRGAIGEIEVGQVLDAVSGWTALHAVPVGTAGSDIDHVIVGPGGVFTINTKNHSGKKIWVAGSRLLVNGHKQDHIRNSLHEARRAAKLLSASVGFPVTVTPVVVVVRPASLTVRSSKTESVTVLDSRRLARWLGCRKPVLPPDHVASITAAATRVVTWSAVAAPLPDYGGEREWFARLHRTVTTARRRAQLWILAALAALVATMFALLAQVPGIMLGFL